MQMPSGGVHPINAAGVPLLLRQPDLADEGVHVPDEGGRDLAQPRVVASGHRRQHRRRHRIHAVYDHRLASPAASAFVMRRLQP